MPTYPIFNQAGRLFAFEIENVYIGRRKIAAVLGSVEGVSAVKLGGSFLSTNDVRVEFLYGGQPYVVWEPYGDSSRFWIGPREESDEPIDIQLLEQVFRSYRPPLPTRVLGDLASFSFFTLRRK